MSSCITITGDNFENEVINSPVPVLLDFWAAWCGPCKMVAPVLDQLAEEYSGRIKVGKINVEEESTLASQHRIMSIPALVVYNSGNVANQAVGALPKQNIESLFKDLL